MAKNTKNNAIEEAFNVMYDLFCNICVKALSFIWLNIIWYGVKNLWTYKNKKIFVLTLTVLLISTIMYVNQSDWMKLYCITPMLIYLVVSAIVFKIRDFINGEQSKIFELINFKDKSGNYPTIIKTQKFKSKKSGKRLKILIIKSLIPFSTWKSNKELLEHAFNSSISLRPTKQKQVIKIFMGGN